MPWVGENDYGLDVQLFQLIAAELVLLRLREKL